MLFSQSKKPDPIPVNERVAVSLKSLIDLAKLATRIHLHRGNKRTQQSGGYVSRFKGRGMEFDEARLYQAGDDIRSIDWRVTARTGKPHTKIFREERERPVFISVDNRLTMQFATRGVFKSVLASKLAGLLAWAAEYQGDRIGGQIFSDYECLELKPQNGRSAVLRFLHALVAKTNPNPTITKKQNAITLDHVLARLNQHARPGSLVYIISDFRCLNSVAESYLTKLAQHCEVVLIFIYDPLETSLPLKGRYRFTDNNRDVLFDANDKDRLLSYQQRFELRKQQLESLAKKQGLSFITCSTLDDPLQCLR
ncbi:MAG: DUF58 domain-containing protein [Methylococcales bacterium]|nr:DUF58 domain-containing protein [Methylococcales bacterium]